MMRAEEVRVHRKCLDVGIRILKVSWMTEDKIKLRVEWVYKDPKRGSLGIFENIEIQREEWHSWKRV
jgi:hypothetical protein